MNILPRVNYPGEYVQLPWGERSTTLGSMLNYLVEYVQLPWGVCSTTFGSICSTTLGSMFNYPGEYVQLPSGVCSTTLGSMFNYPREYVQPPWGGIFKYPRIFGNIVKSKCFARGCLKKVRKTSSENAGEDLPAAAARCRPPPDPPTVGRPLRPSPPPTGGDD